MKTTFNITLLSLVSIGLLGCSSTNSPLVNTNLSHALTHHTNVSNAVIAEQRAKLAKSLKGTEGAQSPRDINSKSGKNTKSTITAPAYSKMNLCDIHFHKGTEHKGGEFTTYRGNGNGEGYGSGYKYNGTLTKKELTPYTIENAHNPLHSGDTIEVHYVYSSNPKATLGHGLGTCLTGINYPIEAQPLLRVEARVYVLVNDGNGKDFTKITAISKSGNQASLPVLDDKAVEYEGSTTGPGYNEKVSPYQVTWRVHPKVQKLNIKTVEEWFGSHGKGNVFTESHAHGVRNLLTNPALLSKIK